MIDQEGRRNSHDALPCILALANTEGHSLVEIESYLSQKRAESSMQTTLFVTYSRLKDVRRYNCHESLADSSSSIKSISNKSPSSASFVAVVLLC